jgi:hypothetical protein
MNMPLIACLCRRFLAALLLSALLLATTTPSSKADLDLDACRSAVKTQNQAPRLVCSVPFVPTEEERKVIIQETMKMVLDLRCSLSVDVSKDELATMATTDSWKAPAQSATCDVVTSERSHVAMFSLAPEITLIDGKAIGVKLNADDFESVPPMIGRALKSYINFNTAFQDELMDFVNKNLKDRHAKKKKNADT